MNEFGEFKILQEEIYVKKLYINHHAYEVGKIVLKIS